jgi:hypothetical protein
VLVSRGLYGTRLRLAEEASSAASAARGTLRPFDIRWADRGNGRGEWQIYLPLGCLTVEQDGTAYSYIPVNSAAKDADGEEIPDWYSLAEPGDARYAKIVETAGYEDKAWTATILLKPWPRAKVGFATEDSAFGRTQWAVAVGEIHVREFRDGGATRRFAVRTADKDAYAFAWDVSAPFSIRYDYAAADFLDPAAKPRAALCNQMLFLGRLQTEATVAKDVSSWEDVWLTVTHDSTQFSSDTTHGLSGDAAVSDDDRTVFRLYILEDMVPKADYRAHVPDFDFYTNAPEATPSDGGE